MTTNEVREPFYKKELANALESEFMPKSVHPRWPVLTREDALLYLQEMRRRQIAPTGINFYYLDQDDEGTHLQEDVSDAGIGMEEKDSEYVNKMIDRYEAWLRDRWPQDRQWVFIGLSNGPYYY